MPMRRVLPARREPDARDEDSWLGWVAVQHDGLRRTRQRSFEFDILRKLEDARVGALCVGPFGHADCAKNQQDMSQAPVHDAPSSLCTKIPTSACRSRS